MENWSPVALPSGGRQSKADVVRAVDAWLGSAPLQRLVGVFGGDLANLEGAERAEMLERFASQNWDFRAGRERDQAAVIEFDHHLAQEIETAAAALGLSASRSPQREEYDAMIILGGLARACIVRPRFAASLLSRGLRVGSVAALGGFRALSSDEQKIARAQGLDELNEFGILREGVKRAFKVNDAFVETGSSQNGGSAFDWQISTSRKGRVIISVIAATSSEPQVRRANTNDTYRYWADHSGLSAGAAVLVVTTPIYVPYQGAGAIEVLGFDYDFEVETVGVDADAANLGEETQQFGPQQYLQEVRSAIHGMRNLRMRASSQ